MICDKYIQWVSSLVAVWPFVAECMAKNCQKCSSKPNKCIKCKAGFKKNKKGRCGMYISNIRQGFLHRAISTWLSRWELDHFCLNHNLIYILNPVAENMSHISSELESSKEGRYMFNSESTPVAWVGNRNFIILALHWRKAITIWYHVLHCQTIAVGSNH